MQLIENVYNNMYVSHVDNVNHDAKLLNEVCFKY